MEEKGGQVHAVQQGFAHPPAAPCRCLSRPGWEEMQNEVPEAALGAFPTPRPRHKWHFSAARAAGNNLEKPC